MADSKHWAKAQAERLEEKRAQELELREMWFKTEKAKKDEAKKKEEAAGWAWGSWWWGKWDWSQDQWWEEGKKSAEPTASTEVKAEPTASTEESSGDAFRFPSRTLGEDYTALRNAAMTPGSFMPQRHVTMALGRPVAVFGGIRHAFGAFGVE